MSFSNAKRQFVLGSLAAAAVSSFPALSLSSNPLLRKPIPASSETISAIGMGSWITFNIGRDEYLQEKRTQVLSTFFDMGGELVDSSPMYGSSEQVIGNALRRLTNDDSLFSASKVWTSSPNQARNQFQTSRQLWDQRQFDLIQVHNLVGCENQLALLKELKQDNLIRYIGVTTSHGRRHSQIVKIMKRNEVEFVQFTYNIMDNQAQAQLLPLAGDLGIAVIANRPFRGGHLFKRIRQAPLPDWAVEVGCSNWAQFFLRFVISHPNVTCAIPATSRVDHMQQNMQALQLQNMPTASQRKLMLQYFRKVI